MADNPALHGDDLEVLARQQFGELSEAEGRMLLAAPKGEMAICGPSLSPGDPANDPAKGDAWEGNREIRAGVIRWLCVDPIASKKVDPRGVLVLAAKITEGLDLSFANVPFPLRLSHCRLMADVQLANSRIPALSLDGSSSRSLNAEGADVRGGVFLGGGFTAVGVIWLAGARIGETLLFGSATLKNPGDIALYADGIDVRGDVYLNDGFSAEGGVSLVGAQIGGALACERASFRNPGGVALRVEGAEVGKSVNLREGFSAVGEVRLLSSRIARDLSCRGATFSNAGGLALCADGVEVRGSLFLSDGFSADGEVRFLDAVIAGVVICDGGRFSSRGAALSLENVKAGGNVFLRDGFTAKGGVNLGGAQIVGGLSCSGGEFVALRLQNGVVNGVFLWSKVRNAKNVRLDLKNATVGAIEDDELSWPAPANLFLDGFSYGRIAGGPTDASARLEWLDRQREFTPQPYRQLAKVLREMGDDEGAKRVSFELEKRARAADKRRLVRSPVRWLVRSTSDAISDATVGYGVYPGRAIWGLCALTAVGWIVHRRAGRVGAMAPAEKEAYAEFHNTKSQTPVRYQPFNPLIYSIENCIPLVKLGQDERWQPDPNPHRVEPPIAEGRFRRVVASALDFVVRDWAVTPTALRWFRWIMIGLGWLLATFFVAGLTGIIKVG
jgi:hypothetical protein